MQRNLDDAEVESWRTASWFRIYPSVENVTRQWHQISELGKRFRRNIRRHTQNGRQKRVPMIPGFGENKSAQIYNFRALWKNANENHGRHAIPNGVRLRIPWGCDGSRRCVNGCSDICWSKWKRRLGTVFLTNGTGTWAKRCSVLIFYKWEEKRPEHQAEVYVCHRLFRKKRARWEYLMSRWGFSIWGYFKCSHVAFRRIWMLMEL